MSLQDKKAKYTPDRWIIVEIEYEGDKMAKILSGWSGGYLHGDSWRLSSVITKIEEDDQAFFVTNETGSTYYIRKTAIGLNSMSANTLHAMLNQTVFKTVPYQDLNSISDYLQKFKV